MGLYRRNRTDPAVARDEASGDRGKDGFLYRAKRFHSLSQIARTITGSRRSGPLFFGLKSSRKGWKLVGARPHCRRSALIVVEIDGAVESDRYKAQGLVAQIQKVVNVKDSFTRINLERERAQAPPRATRSEHQSKTEGSRGSSRTSGGEANPGAGGQDSGMDS
jgi:Protein of unknown function (DUF2924)